MLTWLWEGCVAEVRGGGLSCWGLCVFVTESLRRLWVFSVVVRFDSSNGCVVWLKYFSSAIYKLGYVKSYL